VSTVGEFVILSGGEAGAKPAYRAHSSIKWGDFSQTLRPIQVGFVQERRFSAA